MRCKICDKKCFDAYCMQHKPRRPLATKKRMKSKGKKTLAYEAWRDNVAKPYLDKTFGHICSKTGCHETEGLQVDHIRNRSTHPQLVMELSNVQYLCGPHHFKKTFHIKEA